MDRRSKIAFLFVILGLAAMACDIPFMTARPAPIGTPSPIPIQPSSTAISTPTSVQATDTLLPEPTLTPGEPPPLLQAPATPVTLDLTAVTLKIDDFPPGFAQLDSITQQQIGISQDTVAAMFQGMFSQARPQNDFAFINVESASYQLVFGNLFFPLTATESAAFDQELNDPTKAMRNFTSGLGANAGVLPGADALGEKSIGFTFTTPANSITLRSDMLMVRRGSVVIILITMYQDGAKPDIDAISLATILDGRLKDSLSN